MRTSSPFECQSCAPWIFVLSVLVLASMTTFVFAQTNNLTEEERLELFNRLARASNGRFILSGDVVDPDGNHLSGVTVLVEKSISLGLDSAAESTETRLVNGTFHFDYQGYGGILLTFELAGYHSQKFQFMMRPDRDAMSLILAGQPVPAPEMTNTDLRVVLNRIGSLTDLVHYGGMLEYTVPHAGKVLDCDLPHYGKKALRAVGDVTDSAQLPSNAVYIVADQNSDGTIATIQFQRPRSSVTYTLPQRVRLIMSDPNGGFIVFNPSARVRICDQMKTVPQAGYQHELVCDSDYFASAVEPFAGGEEREMYFFFKTRGRYGKGSVGEVVVKKGARTVLLGVEFLVQTIKSCIIQ
jgi:hypothetical protein